MENWKSIPGYEGYYEVSDLGNVRSLDREIEHVNRWGTLTINKLKGKNLALAETEPTPGYFRLTAVLSKNNKAKTRLVHHLVMEAFEGPRPSGYEVAHNDGNSLNNEFKNLRYALPMDNTHDKFRHGTMLRGARVGTSKLSEDQARHIISMRGKCRLIELAEKYGVRESLISRIQTGKRWRHLHEDIEAGPA